MKNFGRKYNAFDQAACYFSFKHFESVSSAHSRQLLMGLRLNTYINYQLHKSMTSQEQHWGKGKARNKQGDKG